MKFFVCFCGVLSMVSFLIPKEKGEEKKAVSVLSTFNRHNDNIRECLVTAMRIDEQKRLDYLKNKPTLTVGTAKRMETTNGGSGSGEWNPILKRDNSNKVSDKRNEFFLLQPDSI
jgi:hypothetical protein